jgi:hypothetical protein
MTSARLQWPQRDWLRMVLFVGRAVYLGECPARGVSRQRGRMIWPRLSPLEV